MLKKLALAGILGLSLTTFAKAPVYAQDMMKMANPLEDLSDEEIDMPVRSLTYPMASPGSLHLSHWADFTRYEMRQGSVDDIRFERERRKDKMYKEVRMTYWDKMTPEQKMKEDEMTAEPTMFNYNMGSPGSLHLSHWHGINKEKWMPGSINDMRMMQEKEKDMMWYGDMKSVTYTEEEMMRMREPVMMNYPMASPGSLHLYHWADYTRSEIMPGSVSDHRMDRDMMERQKYDTDKKMMDKKTMNKK